MRLLIYPTFVFSLYTLAQIADIVSGKLRGNASLEISNMYADTRKSLKQAALFVALKTSKTNGNSFVGTAIHQGASAVLVSEVPKVECDYILVDDTLKALQYLAQYHRTQHTIPVVAITGSNGKTIVKEWLSTLLNDTEIVCKSPKSYNSQIGVPLSLWQLNSSHTIGIFEAGISQPSEMDHLREMIQPTIGVFTHLGDSHAANFESIEQKLAEKLKLFSSCEAIVCSTHQRNVYDAIKQLNKPMFTWGSDVSCNVHVISDLSGDYIVTYQGNSYNIRLANSDKASVENAFTSLSAALVLGGDIEVLLTKINNLPSIDMRLQQIEGIQGNTLIFDFYNSDFQSLDIAFDFLKQQNTHENITVILSDILESNLDTESLYKKVNKALHKYGVHKLIGIGPKISHAHQVFDLHAYFYPDTAAFLKRHAIYELKNECILLKGASIFQFEQIGERLRKRTHQTCLEINLSNMQHNLNAIKTRVGTQTKVMAMVKALAYGSGDYQIAKLLEKNNIDYLGVAYTDEATQLRAAGISIPIMVLNPDLTDLTPYVEQDIQPVIYSFTSLAKVAQRPIKIHLEIDTGMRRLGFQRNDVSPLIDKLKTDTSLQIASIFSHLAVADDPQQDDFTQQQLSDFEHISNNIERQLGISVIKHIANTAAIERLPHARFDMVRMGIGLYGISSVHQDTPLLPVSTFKSYISQIKSVPAGAGVGYGQWSKSTKERKIAVIAVGYADGYSRRFSQGKGAFLINEKFASVVGNVCMDMTMCDVTDIPCAEGDEVIIFGTNPHVSELARQLDTIPYEILTNVSERVNRMYYQE